MVVDEKGDKELNGRAAEKYQRQERDGKIRKALSVLIIFLCFPFVDVVVVPS